ncbi:Asp/Glu racemase [Piscinibacter sp. XHJ-5]|uniref:maleate cis-trans isomerase family protein n=1 Tax=Piscinibacter sp. XHJ-5 TaxID=3037797 RepID=UPI0024530FEE|nr:Asp/Glu racemase [Piscinibacter sp. XHJ-5]
MNARRAPYRVGLIVPSSNTTMELEVPELLRRQQLASGHRFSVHSARLRLRQVTPEALQKMNEAADSAVDMLCDARVDALVYACLVAGMSGGKPGLLETQARLTARAASCDTAAPAIVSSAGALVTALQWLGARRIAMIAPYRRSLTDRVAATLAECGVQVVQSRSLEVVDNAAVGRLDAAKLLSLAAQLDFSGSDALVISACVQMPSLDVVEEAEQRLGLPVLSAATASVFALLRLLGIPPAIAGAGALLRHGERSRTAAALP